MKNISKEIKTKIFANYIGEKLVVNEIYKDFECPLVIHNYSNDLKNGLDINQAIQYNTSIKLKSLSNITKEDMLQYFILDGFKNPNEFNLEIDEDMFGWTHISTHKGISHNKLSKISSICFQYLQSKGYALPYLNYSIKDLVELGIYIIIDTNIKTQCVVCGTTYNNPNNDSDTCYKCKEDIFK